MNKTYIPAFKARLVQELLKETKTISQLAAAHGIHPNLLGTWKATALQGQPSLFERRHSLDAVQATHEQQVQDLYAQIGRLTTQIEWLRKNLALSLSRNECLALVDRGTAELTLTDQADLLSLNRRSLYYQPAPPSAEEVAIKHAIERIYTEQPSYGSRRIAVMLKEDYQLVVNRKAVHRERRALS